MRRPHCDSCSNQSSDGESVTIPLATVTDWPDIAQRGQWGNSAKRDIEWLASMKMNLIEFHTYPQHHIDKSGTAIATIDHSLVRRGKRNATHIVPVISHLHDLQSRGVFDAFPDLRGKGAKAKYKGVQGSWAPCASNPKLIDVLTGWIQQYAKQGANDVSCWLSESTYTCECDACVQDGGQWVHETRAYLEAWRRVKKDYPNLRIRILTTQGSYDTNKQILAELPPEVGVTHYDGHRTYDANREPMIYPLLEKYAASGGSLGVYPTLTPTWRPVLPWSSPQFIKYRMSEFADKKLSSVVGYVVPDNRLYEFNVTASAEWSWNSHGRSEHQFSLAWATRHGYPPQQAETIADWAEMLGPVSWDIYAARLVERYFLRPDYLERYVANRSKTEFGKRFLLHIPDREALESRLQICRRALRLAEQTGASAIESETRVIASYYEMIDAFCLICDFVSEHAEADSRQRLELQQQMNRMGLAGVQNVDALLDWERSVMPGAGGRRFAESPASTRDIIDAVARSLSPYGVQNPISLEMEQRVDGWSIDDFHKERAIEKTIDVTEFVNQSGTYFVKFLYTGGWNGLTIQRVALIAEPKEQNGKAVEISVDEHPGSAANQNRRNQYSVTLKAYDPAMRYRIVASITGSRPEDQSPGKEGCDGSIFLGANRSLDWQTRIVNVQPRNDSLPNEP